MFVLRASASDTKVLIEEGSRRQPTRQGRLKIILCYLDPYLRVLLRADMYLVWTCRVTHSVDLIAVGQYGGGTVYTVLRDSFCVSNCDIFIFLTVEQQYVSRILTCTDGLASQ